MQVIPPTDFSPCARATVLFVVELQDGAKWDFGPVTFFDITMRSYDKSPWCTDQWGHDWQTKKPIVLGVKPQVYGDYSECYIERVTLYP